MPRTKYTKPPGPLPAIEEVQRSHFRFRDNQWRELTKLLPCKLVGLGVPPDAASTFPEKVKTIADCVIQATEDEINSHLTAGPVFSEGLFTPARVLAAIRKLREALKPFERGWVDDETADVVPAGLHAKLVAREQEIVRMRLPPLRQRALALLCQRIAVHVRQYASVNGEIISDQDLIGFVDAALNCAHINHPSLSKHRDRLASLIFPTC